MNSHTVREIRESVSFNAADFLMMVYSATAATQNNFARSVTFLQSETVDSGDHLDSVDSADAISCHSPSAVTWSTSALSASASDGILACGPRHPRWRALAWH
jgi:hypothetical protein